MKTKPASGGFMFVVFHALIVLAKGILASIIAKSGVISSD
jgi:hypothetical protein